MFILFSEEELKDIKELATMLNISEEALVLRAVKHYLDGECI